MTNIPSLTYAKQPCSSPNAFAMPASAALPLFRMWATDLKDIQLLARMMGIQYLVVPHVTLTADDALSYIKLQKSMYEANKGYVQVVGSLATSLTHLLWQISWTPLVTAPNLIIHCEIMWLTGVHLEHLSTSLTGRSRRRTPTYLHHHDHHHHHRRRRHRHRQQRQQQQQLVVHLTYQHY